MLEKIYSLLEGVGMTPEELVLKWAESGRIDLDRIAELVKQNAKDKSSEVKKIKEVEAGMFLTSDMSVCKEFDAEKSLAIVLAVNRSERTALAFNIAGVNLAFSREGLDADTSGFSGLNATHFISQMALDAGVTAEAADYCLNFENALVDKGRAFLPSKDEIKECEGECDKIYQAFAAAKIANKTFWSSTTNEGTKQTSESVGKTAYIFSFGNSQISVHSENICLPLEVHPVYTVDLKKFV